MMPPGRAWHKVPLTWQHAKLFDSVIRKPDLIECLSNGLSVRASLEWAIYEGGGESWAVLEGDNETPVGVFGWTAAGAVWSYWSHLDGLQIRELMRRTPAMVLEMVSHAHGACGLKKLANYVWEGNREAIAWLRGSHCFSLDLDHRYEIGNKKWIAFETKHAEELMHYV